MDNPRHRRMGPLGAGLLVALVAGLGVSTYYYGFWRSVVGIALPCLVIWLGFSYFRAAGQSPPEAPSPLVDEATEIRFRCKMCGLTVRVEEPGSDRPPTHCREKMELILTALPRPVD